MTKDPKFIKANQDTGVTPTWVGPEEFRKILDSDLETYQKIKKELVK